MTDPLHIAETRTDRVIRWMSNHPKVVGIAIAACILAVGYFDGPKP